MLNTCPIENSTSLPSSLPGNWVLDSLNFCCMCNSFPLVDKNSVQMLPLGSYYAIKCPSPLYIQVKIRRSSRKLNTTLEQPLFSFHSTKYSQITQALHKHFDSIVFDVHYIINIKNSVVSLCLSSIQYFTMISRQFVQKSSSYSVPQYQPLMSSSHSPKQ